MIGVYIGLTSNRFDLFSPGTWLSRIIQYATGSKWNHAVIFLNLWGLNVVIHAQLWVRLEMYRDWLAKTDREVAIYEVLEAPDLDWLFSQLNKFYDVLGLLWFGLSILISKIIGRKVQFGPTGTRADKNFFCSELVVRFLGVVNGWFSPSDIPDLEKQGLLKLIGYYRTEKGNKRLIEVHGTTPAPLKVAA